MSSYTNPGFNLSDSFKAGFNSPGFFDPDKFKPKVDSVNSNGLWGSVGDYSGLSSQPQGQFGSSAKEDENTRRQAKILARAFKQNQFQQQGEQPPGYQFVPQQQQAGGGGSVYKPDPYTTVYNPIQQQQPFTVQGSKSGGIGSTIGAAAGLAAGMFIPGAQVFTPQLMALGSEVGSQVG